MKTLRQLMIDNKLALKEDLVYRYMQSKGYNKRVTDQTKRLFKVDGENPRLSGIVIRKIDGERYWIYADSKIDMWLSIELAYGLRKESYLLDKALKEKGWINEVVRLAAGRRLSNHQLNIGMIDNMMIWYNRS
jgi:hypothetical protein